MENTPSNAGSETVNEQPSSKAVIFSPQYCESTATPKANEKRSRGRDGSESSTTPSAQKIAKTSPRATRSSQNPDFAAKQRKFLNRMHDPIRRDNSDNENSQGAITPISSKITKEIKLKSSEKRGVNDIKRKLEKDMTPKRSVEAEEEGSLKKRRTKEPTKVVGGVDSYCWRCHRDGNVISCETCPRVYHLKCVQLEAAPPKGWMCPECSTVMQAENTDTRSKAMRMLSLDQLCNLLRFALNRMQSYEGAEDFEKPVNLAEFPYYRDFIVKPMDLSQLKQNIKAKMYGSTEAFQADAKWIVHNSIIFNSVQSKFTNTARALLKICRQEMQEIENCPDCYQNAHTRSSDSWFIEACRRPHLLVWAKLKGFPFWPAKAMATNSENLVDVRFFGAHDRAWVPVSNCYLYSKLSPAPASNKNKRNLEDCIQELECHIKKLRDKFGQFEYPPYKTPYDPNREDLQLAMFLPLYEMKGPGKRQQRISLHHDGARKVLTQNKTSSICTEHSIVQGSAMPSKSGSLDNKNILSANTSTAVEPTAVNMKVLVPPMVSFPGKSKLIHQTFSTDSSLLVKETTPHKSTIPHGGTGKQSTPAESVTNSKSGTTPTINKSYKIPLTAAAKKCFATFKDNEPMDDSNCITNETEAVQKEPQTVQDDRETLVGNVETKENDVSINKSSNPITGEVPIAVIDEGAGGDGVETVDTGENHIPVGKGDTRPLNFVTVDSPPKFVIPKTCGNKSPETSKKVSIVDRLQEKLCFAVEEAIKGHLNTEEENSTFNKCTEESENILDKTGNEETSTTEETVENEVLVQAIKNTKDVMEQVKESDGKQNVNKTSKDAELETHSSSEISSEADTDASSSVESDSFITNEDDTKKKKQKNINNVVRNIKERKSSVDEIIDQNNKDSKAKDTTSTVLLDDSNDDISVLIIDENEYNSNDGKKSPGKSDKSRRKGIPAKVYSRSSTSTESSDISSPEEQSSKSKGASEVLDEVSGQFRRSSGESNVTITVVTDDAAPQKKTQKEIRSVNISKSLSLSVINDSSTSVEIECIESDCDEQVIVDSVIKKVMPRPTARKTLPNPPRSVDLPISQEAISPSVPNKAVEPEVKIRPTQALMDQSASTLHLTNQRTQTKVFGPSKGQSSSGPVAVKYVPAKAPSSFTPRVELGPANAHLEEAVSKLSGHLRSMMEEILRGMSESGATEATVKAMQLELERIQWRHRQEVAELKHNTDLLVMEIRATLEAEKQRALLDSNHKHEVDKEQAVQETKRKQWCAYCLKEAQLYCCWNTAYCSYSCQQSHWMPHMNSCLNKQQGTNNADMPLRITNTPTRPAYNMPMGQMHECNAWIKSDDEVFETDDNRIHKHVARKRCGVCEGCNAQPCGECYGCTSPKSHSVCKNRRCSLILTKVAQKMRPDIMPPPCNPPQYHQPYRPNQMYTAAPRFNNGPRPSPHVYPLDTHYPRGQL